MAEVFVKPYVPDQQSVDQLYYPSYLPTELNYSQYASLHPDVSDIIDQPALPIETRYDPWEAVAAQVRKKYPQQERPIPLLGTGGAERYQTWPERTIRSALTLPVETYQGTVQSGPGLRREDVTDIPGQAQPLDPLMERAQDVAGLAGGTMFAGVPKGAATLGAGPVKQGIKPYDWKVKGFENENWFHGTTHDFSKFDLNKGNVESHLGVGPYFSSSVKDVSSNYAGFGPDLTNRISNLAEKYLPDEMPKYNTPEYKTIYDNAIKKATVEIAGQHEGAIIPVNLKLDKPVSISDVKPTWLDFNAKYDKDGEWIKDALLTIKLLNAFKKQGKKYGFNGEEAFNDVFEKASLYDGEVKASSLDKAMRNSEKIQYLDNEHGELIGSQIISNIYKDLGFDGIVMDAKSAFPNMNIPEGTLHAVPLKRNTVASKYTGDVLYSETSKVGAPLAALEKAPMFYSAVENAVKASKQNVATKEQWLSYLKNQQGVKPEEMQWTGLDSLPEGKITKQQLEQHIAENKAQFNEVWKGDKEWVQLQYKDTLSRQLEGSFKNILNEFKSPSDVAIAKKHNIQFAETVKGKSNEEVFNAIQEAKKLPTYSNEFFNKYDTLAEAKAAVEKANAGEHIEIVPKREKIDTKYHSYSLPGGENYRELLLQLPIKSGPEGNAVANFAKQMREKYGERWISEASSVEMRRYDDLINAQEKAIDKPELSNFKSDHWDEPNVLAHIRMNDREIPDVGKSLHIEEIQSDWHQKGRKEGYKVSEAEKNRMTKELQDIQKERAELVSNDKPYVVGQFESRYAELNQKEADLTDRYNALVHDAVPDAPFKKTWDELAIKRVIRQAVEEGKDAISWTPGEAQAARYDLSKHVDTIHAFKHSNGNFDLSGIGKDGRSLNFGKDILPNKLPDFVGKELAEKIIKQENESKNYSGLDLKVGGEGMKGFYDKMMVDKVNNLAKKYGGKVEQKEIKSGGKPSDEIELPEGRPLEVVKKENGSYTIKLEGSDNTWGLFGREIWAKERLKVLQKAWDEGRQPIHVLKLTPELKEAALTKGFALFSETSKVGAPLSALEKSGMTPEIKSRIVPAIKNYETGKIETVSRGKSHEELMMNYHQKSKGNPNASYMDIVNNGLKNNETGYYDPKTKQFYNRDSVSDLESTELMTPTQLKKYEQNKVLWSSGLQFPKPLEQPSFNERWNERIPADMSVEERKGIQPFPTNYTPPERFLEKRPVRLTKVDYDPFTK